ncbi:Methyltransferase-like protein 6 [Nymphon striatum]|nr:Methyltransferase-like protein 6 [Nymphon striatum]
MEIQPKSNDDTSYFHKARKLNENEVEMLKIQDKKLISEFKQNKLEQDAKKNWDLFYKRNGTRFFKDRHWTQREFEELGLVKNNEDPDDPERPVLLEVGCGVGNLIFPLISNGSKYFIYACDFSFKSCRACKATFIFIFFRCISPQQENELYNEVDVKAFQNDLVKDSLKNQIHEQSVDICTLMFVLSAIHPDNMQKALNNLYEVLKPGGVVLFRDYGLYDQAMIRFKPGSKIYENFYVRQDGTRAYYFSTEILQKMFVSVGFEVIHNSYVNRITENPKEGISVPRVFVQSKFKKP